jgi:feruloyl esterase
MGLPTKGAIVISAELIAATPRTDKTVATPEYCSVQGVINPVDSEAPPIKFEVHLPTEWNHRSIHFGGGGFNGSVPTDESSTNRERPDSPRPIARGYVTFGSDSGHSGPGYDGSFALNNEALLNFAYEALKKTKDAAFEIMHRYYGAYPKYGYFYGASEGGREGYTVTQRFPKDYNGVIALDPILSLMGSHIHDNATLTTLAHGGWMNSNKIALVTKSTLDLCDEGDGLKDGVISKYGVLDPVLGWKAACPHDATRLRCPTGKDEGDWCLSDAQLATVNMLRNPFVLPFKLVSGSTGYIGFGAMGGESDAMSWAMAQIGSQPPPVPQPPGVWDISKYGAPMVPSFGHNNVRFLIAQNPNFQTYDFDPVPYQTRIQYLSSILDSINPDISEFMKHGGKLIMREDTCDHFRSPFLGINYYKSLLDKFGEKKVDSSVRLFVAVGANHFGQSAPSKADLISLLENWVEKGTAPPKNIVGVDMDPGDLRIRASRPMCGYGLYPRYNGTGDPKDASSFTCTPLLK